MPPGAPGGIRTAEQHWDERLAGHAELVGEAKELADVVERLALARLDPPDGRLRAVTALGELQLRQPGRGPDDRHHRAHVSACQRVAQRGRVPHPPRHPAIAGSPGPRGDRGEPHGAQARPAQAVGVVPAEPRGPAGGAQARDRGRVAVQPRHRLLPPRGTAGPTMLTWRTRAQFRQCNYARASGYAGSLSGLSVNVLSTPRDQVGQGMSFAGMLRGLMEEHGLGVAETARQVPCDKAYISRLASGRQRPSRQVASRLDEVFGCGGGLTAAAGFARPPAAGTSPHGASGGGAAGLLARGLRDALLDYGQLALPEGLPASAAPPVHVLERDVASALAAYQESRDS